MATTWWKILILQILMSALTNSSALEFDDNPRLSNENNILLFNKFLENINNQHVTEEMNDKVEQMKDLYHQSLWASLNSRQNYGKFTENDKKNDDLSQFEDYQNVNGVENLNEKSLQRGKKHYVTTLCRFKICNRKKSMDNYDSFIRYEAKRYNPQVLD